MKEVIASIIIRTKNEEKWIKHCLKKVFEQECNFKFEVLIVDNNSEDKTLNICRKFNIKKIIKIKKYKPGLSLNIGIRKSAGKYIVCLSAHCIPKNKQWLKDLICNFTSDDIAAVYGRQIPLTYSNPNDVRDMLIVFGLDKKIQVKDSFFHNANSAIRKTLLNKYPFDNKVQNIEDRIWAKKIINKRFKIIYEPKAAVFHYHGIHQNQNISRAKSTFNVLKKENYFLSKSIPETMKPSKIDVTAFIPLSANDLKYLTSNDLKKLSKQIKDNNYIKNTYLFIPKGFQKKIKSITNMQTINRNKSIEDKKVNIDEVLKWCLEKIEDKDHIPDLILFINPTYLFRPKKLFNNLINLCCYYGYDTVFAGTEEFNQHWTFDNLSGYTPIINSFVNRDEKKPIFKSLIGLGCITQTHLIRSKKIIGENIGILKLTDKIYSLRYQDVSSINLKRIKKINIDE